MQKKGGKGGQKRNNKPALGPEGGMVSGQKKKNQGIKKSPSLRSNQQENSKHRVIGPPSVMWCLYTFFWQVHKTVYCSRCSRQRVNQVEPSYSTNVNSGCSNLASHGMRGDDRLWPGIPKTRSKWPQNVKTGQNWPKSSKTDPKWPQNPKTGSKWPQNPKTGSKWPQSSKTDLKGPQSVKVSGEGFDRHRQGIGRAGGQAKGLEIVEAGTRCTEPSKSDLIQNFILETPVLRFSRYSR